MAHSAYQVQPGENTGICGRITHFKPESAPPAGPLAPRLHCCVSSAAHPTLQTLYTMGACTESAKQEARRRMKEAAELRKARAALQAAMLSVAAEDPIHQVSTTFCFS